MKKIIFSFFILLYSIGFVLVPILKAESSVVPETIDIKGSGGERYEKNIRVNKNPTTSDFWVNLKIEPSEIRPFITIKQGSRHRVGTILNWYFITLEINLPKNMDANTYEGRLVISEDHKNNHKINREVKINIEIEGDGNMKCSDSDGGKEYYQKGKVVGGYYNAGEYNHEPLEDYCMNATSKTLIEYYCIESSNKVGEVRYPCNYGCADGQCNKTAANNKIDDNSKNSKNILEAIHFNWQSLILLFLGRFFSRYARKKHQEDGGVSFYERSLGKIFFIIGLFLLFV